MYIVKVKGVYPTYDATPEPTLAHMLMLCQGELADYKELTKNRPDQTPFEAEVHLNKYRARDWPGTVLIRKVWGVADIPFPNQAEVNNFILKHRAAGRV